jgi:hypothetical protein
MKILTWLKNKSRSKKAVASSAPVSAREAFFQQLKDPTIQNNLLHTARALQQRFNKNWFTTSQLIKKTGVSNIVEGRQLMHMLTLLGYAEQKKEDDGVLKYKITINPAVRIAILEHQVKELDVQKARTLELIEEIKKNQNQLVA